MRFLAALFCAVWSCGADDGRVLFMSFDGLGYQALHSDPAAAELRSLRKWMRGARQADGLIAAFPSTTANSHAVLWTGVYAPGNGIVYNRTTAAPRSEHLFTDRVNGFRSEGLIAEPIWVTAAKRGVNVVAHQVTQAYPFRGEARANLVVANTYQSEQFSPWRVLRRKDMREVQGRFEWEVAGVAVQMLMGRGRVEIRSGGQSVTVIARAEETSPPRSRALARHWSKPLPLAGLRAPASVVFRLFELGDDFVLLQGPVQEFAAQGLEPREIERLLRETGPPAGNGAHSLYVSGELGDARRYLESVEWVVRQQIAHSDWLLRERKPRLHITYLPFPDEVEHTWLGHPDAAAWRAWGYAAVDRAFAALVRHARPRDHVAVVSDHGMAPVHSSVAVNVALEKAGLKQDAVMLSTCVLVNTTEWKDGTVTPERYERVVDAVELALRREIPVLTRIYRPGPHGPDLCFDVAPGYGVTESVEGEIVRKLSRPKGEHGFDPIREDMQAVLMVSGPGFDAGTWPRMRSSAVAPLVLRLVQSSP